MAIICRGNLRPWLIYLAFRLIDAVGVAGQARYISEDRIVGGYKINITDAPYQAIIRLNGMTFCGAVVIGREVLLTAAHCIQAPVQSITVKVGATHSEDEGTVHAATHLVSHELYDKGPPEHYDIGLVFVAPPLQFSRVVWPLDAVTEAPKAGTVAIVTGYGSVEERGEPSRALLKTIVFVADLAACNRSYNGSLGPDHLCAGFADGGRDTCQGDSGGPLVVDGRLAGVTSYGEGCGHADHPGLYTNVAVFRSWVEHKIRLYYASKQRLYYHHHFLPVRQPAPPFYDSFMYG